MGLFGAGGGGRRSVSGFWRAGVASESVAVWPCREPRISGCPQGTEKGLRPAGRSSLAALGSFRQALGRSAPCLVDATWRGCDPLVPDSHLGPFCRRFRSLFIPECGKDSAGGAARKGFRAERAERAERVGFVWSERVVEVLAPGFGPEGVGLQISKSGQGSFQQSALSRQPDKGENTGGAPQRAGGAERRRIAGCA